MSKGNCVINGNGNILYLGDVITFYLPLTVKGALSGVAPFSTDLNLQAKTWSRAVLHMAGKTLAHLKKGEMPAESLGF